MDTIIEDHVEVIVICKPAQIGGSVSTYAVAAYFTHQEPRPILIVMADQQTAEAVSERRLQKTFHASPGLSKTIKQFTKTELDFLTGARIKLAWASSVAGLGTFEFGILILDEIDKPGYYTSTKEAGPISLAIERTETYYNRKIVMLSTPTIETGNITQQLESCDVIYDWHIPCPHCGQHQPLRWSREHTSGFPDGNYRAEDGTIHQLGGVVWDGGREATPEQIEAAGYVCGECGAIWNTIEKNNAVEQGKMVARKEPQNPPKKVGFHVNRLYSLLGQSGNIPKLVRNWLDVQDRIEDLQGFINSTLAEPWKQITMSATSEQVLKARCALASQVVPQQAIALTCGIDMQLYGFWFVVRAWARDYTRWLIHYGQLANWEELETLLFDTAYPVEGNSDRTLRIWRAGIDTGGGEGQWGITMTEQAYWWVRKNGVGRGCNVWGTKGSSTPLAGRIKVGKTLDKTPSGKAIPGGLQIISLDTGKLKDAYHYHLNQAIDQMPMGGYLHSETGEDYASHILAEEKRLNEKGLEEWVQIKRDNHLLDAEVISMACADPEWPGGGVNLLIPRKARPAPQQDDRKSSFIPQPRRGFLR